MFKKSYGIMNKALALSFIAGSSVAYAGSISPQNLEYVIASGESVSVDLTTNSGEDFWYLKDVSDYYNHQGVLTINGGFLSNLALGQHSFEVMFNDSSKDTLTITVIDDGDQSATVSPASASFDISKLISPIFTLDLNGGTLENIELAGQVALYDIAGSALMFDENYLQGLAIGSHNFILKMANSANLNLTVKIVDTTIFPPNENGDFTLNADEAVLSNGAELQSSHIELAQGLVEWIYVVDVAGEYDIDFVYQSPHGEKTNKFYVNGEVNTVITAASSDDNVYSMTANLAIGEHKIGVDGRGQWGYISVRGVNLNAHEIAIPSPTLTPSILSFDHKAPADVSYSLILDGAILDAVSIDNVTLSKSEYAMPGNTLILSSDYVAGLADGQYPVTVSFSDAENVSVTLIVKTTLIDIPTLSPSLLTFNSNTPSDIVFDLLLEGHEIASTSVTGTAIIPTVSANIITISKHDLLALNTAEYSLLVVLTSGLELEARITVLASGEHDPSLPSNADITVSASDQNNFRDYLNSVNNVHPDNYIDLDTIEFDWNGKNMYGDELYGRDLGENVGIIWAGWSPSHYTGSNYDYKMGLIDANNIKRVSFIPTYFIDTYEKGVIVGNDQMTLNKDEQARILTELFSRGIRLNYRAHIDPMRFAYGQTFDANGPGAKYWRGLFNDFDPMDEKQNYKAVMNEGLYVVAKAIRDAKRNGFSLQEPVRFDLGAELMESSKNFSHNWLALVDYVRGEIAGKYSDVANDIILSHNFSHHIQYMMEIDKHEAQFRRIISGGEEMTQDSLYDEFNVLLFIDDMNALERNDLADYLRALDAVTISQYMPLDTNNPFRVLDRENVNIDVTADDVKKSLQMHEQNFIQKVILGKLGLKFSELPQFHLGEYGMGLRGLYSPNIWNAADWQEDEMLTFDAQQKHAKVAINGLMDYMEDPTTMAKSLQIWISGAPYDVLRFYQNDGEGLHVGDNSHGINGCSPYNQFAAKALWDYWGGQAYSQTMTADNRCEEDDADGDGYNFVDEIGAGSDPYDYNSTPDNIGNDTPLSNKNSDENTVKLYDAIKKLPEQETNNVLSGQFGGYSGIDNNDLGRYNGVGEYVTDKNGNKYAENEMVKYDKADMERPVIYACDFAMGWNPYVSGDASSLTAGGVVIGGTTKGPAMNYSCTEDLIVKAGEGHIIQVSNHLPNPTYSGLDNYKKAVNDESYKQIFKAGTEERKNWLAIMDVVAAGLQKLEDDGVSVIYRPLHEMNGDWFWWGADNSNGGSTERQVLYKALYQDMHKYFTETKGLDNLIWVWSPDASRNNMTGYYPGDNYVDIVGLDAYTASYLSIDDIVNDYNTLTTAFPAKPFALAEIGPKANHSNDSSAGVYGMWTPQTPLDYATLLDTIKVNMPKVVYFAAWNLGYAPSYKTGVDTMPNNGVVAFKKENLATLGEF